MVYKSVIKDSNLGFSENRLPQKLTGLSIWVNFITTSLRPSPGNHGLFQGNHPQMAELFRLAKCYNLPRSMFSSFSLPHMAVNHISECQGSHGTGNSSMDCLDYVQGRRWLRGPWLMAHDRSAWNFSFGRQICALVAIGISV